MNPLLQYLHYASTAAFVALGLVTLIDWVRAPSRRRAYIAMTLVLLAVVSLSGVVTRAFPTLAWIITPFSLLAFQFSAVGLLLLRNSYLPIPRLGWVVATVALAGTLVALLVVGVPAAHPSRVQTSAVVGLILAWNATVAEPTVRFWLASRHLPIVQRRRMQALSLGYLGIILVLLTAVIPSAAGNQNLQVATSVASLLIAPLLYAAFSPPRWLRRAWREGEEEPFREAVHDLLLFSPTRHGLAERAVDWAVRLVGADLGMLVDGDGSLMSARGAGAEEASARAGRLLGPGSMPVVAGGGLSGAAIVLPLPLDSGTGYLVVEAGPFTPVFGQDEVQRLRQYASSVTVALDRARVSERAIALEEVKSRFLKLASHELRGPLALVKGYTSMVTEGSLSPEEFEKVMPMIQGRLEQMSGMLNEMLETARLEDDRLELKPELFDLRQALSSVIEALRPLAGRDHPFKVNVPSREVNVLADRARVETIVTNLIDNAIKYSPGGGEVDCSVEVRDGAALVEVRDHGIGIAKDDMKTLFTRFGRITSDATVSIPGTGLGLYLSRELARMHRGDLTASSLDGQGSTFTLRLPLAEGAG